MRFILQNYSTCLIHENFYKLVLCKKKASFGFKATVNSLTKWNCVVFGRSIRNNWLNTLNQQKRRDFNSNNECVKSSTFSHPTDLR